MTQKEKIGLNFRFARMKANITIEDFAKAMDDWSPIISNFERKGQAPSFKKFIKWCDALNVSLDRIIYGDDYKKILNLQNIAKRLKVDEEYHNNFCNLLKCKREEQHLSYKDVAALCSISAARIFQIEHGAFPSVATLCCLCKIYNIENLIISLDNIENLIASLDNIENLIASSGNTRSHLSTSADKDSITYGYNYQQMLCLQRIAKRCKKDDVYHTYICDVLRRARKKKGLTLQNVSDLCNTSRQALSAVELGKRGISDKWLCILCKLYDLSIEELEANEVVRTS